MIHLPLLALVIVLLALALFVLSANLHSPVNRWFAAFTSLVALWALGITELQSHAYLNPWARFTFASATLIPAAFLAFMRAYSTPAPWPSTRTLRLFLFAGGTIALLSLLTPLTVRETTHTPAGLSRTTGPLYVVFVFYFLLVWIVALAVFFSKWRHSRGIHRAQLQYLGAGIILSALGAISLNLFLPFLTGHSAYSWIGPYFSLILVALVGHAIIRHRLMDLRLFVSRGLSYAVAVALTSGLLITLFQTLAPQEYRQSVALQPNLLIAVLVVLVLLTTPAQRFFLRLVAKYFYRGAMDHASALPRAMRRLTRLMQPIELANEIHHLLNEAFVPETFRMVVRRFGNNTLENFSPHQDQREDIDIAIDPAILMPLLMEHTSPSLLLIPQLIQGHTASSSHEALGKAGVEVVVILARRGQSLGALLLGPRRSGDAYFAEDLVFVEALAELASIALENALFYRQQIQMLEYAERLLESIDSAVIAIDLNGTITSFNPAAARLLGFRPITRGDNLAALPTEIAWGLAFAAADIWRAQEFELVIDPPAGTPRHVILSTAVLHDEQDRVSGSLAVVTDVSALKTLELNQRRVEHFATMARFYAGIAHEIRNPLAAISNLVSMLPDRFDDPEYRDTAARLLPAEVGRIVRLAERLRLLAPSEAGTLSPVDLSPLLSDIVAIHSPGSAAQGVKISLHCPENLPRILGDSGQLVQLFVNLLRNAVEAVPHGGHVTIEANDTPMDKVVVRVVDDGVGIEPSLQSKIFDPFFTTKPSGIGLGLSICQEISKFHGARFSLRSRGDLLSGTVAELEFPIVHAGGPLE